jgi:hypothetical protein
MTKKHQTRARTVLMTPKTPVVRREVEVPVIPMDWKGQEASQFDWSSEAERVGRWERRSGRAGGDDGGKDEKEEKEKEGGMERKGRKREEEGRETHLENGRRVVVDGVDTGTVLPHEEGGGDEHAAEKEALSEELAEGGEESSADGGAVVLDLHVDLVDLVDDVGVLGVEATDEAKVLDRFVATVAGNEPTRRLADEEGDTSEENSARD